jgi:hypothetical protein
MLKTQPVPIINEIKIPFPKTYSASKTERENQEYSINEGLFDPSKSSPPNEFMLKLYMRMSQHTNLFYKNEDNRNSE